MTSHEVLDFKARLYATFLNAVEGLVLYPNRPLPSRRIYDLMHAVVGDNLWDAGWQVYASLSRTNGGVNCSLRVTVPQRFVKDWDPPKPITTPMNWPPWDLPKGLERTTVEHNRASRDLTVVYVTFAPYLADPDEWDDWAVSPEEGV